MNQSDNHASEDIVSSRLLDYPPDVVYGAFSDPSCLARWWGPRGFTNTFEEFDLRPGGSWRFVMHGPDGASYPTLTKFVEVSSRQIVFEHVEPIHRFWMTMTFANEAGQTRLTWRMR